MATHNVSSVDLNSHLRIHYQLEEATLKHLLKLSHEFRDYKDLLEKEKIHQKEVIDRIWLLTQRYMILVSTGPCCKYPEIYTAPAEDVILLEYNEKLKLLRSSNCRLLLALNHVRANCRGFENLYSQLDHSIESPFMMGDTFHKPIKFFVEFISDIFRYLHTLILKMKYYGHLFDPADPTNVSEYKNILLPSEDFDEYFKIGLVYCKCLMPKLKC